MNTPKTTLHLAAAVVLLLGLDVYANREIRSLSTEVAATERSIAARFVKLRRAAATTPASMAGSARAAGMPGGETKDGPSGSVKLAGRTELARSYSMGSADTRNFPGR